MKYRVDFFSAGRDAAAKRYRFIHGDVVRAVKAALADQCPANPRALEARLGISYFQARRALIKLGKWNAPA